MKTKKKNKILGITCALLTLTSLACVGHITNNKTGWFDELRNQTDSILPEKDSVQIRDHGIRIKGLKSGTTTEGYQTKTFSYVVVPSTATDKSVIGELKYKDGSSCADVMNYEINTEESTITLICKQDFNKEIEFTLKLSANENIKGVVSIGYVKKVKSIQSYTDKFHPIGVETLDSTHSSAPLLDIVYSKYTKDSACSIKASGGQVVFDGMGDAYDYQGIYEALRGLVENVYVPHILNNINLKNTNISISQTLASNTLQYFEELQSDVGDHLYNWMLKVYGENLDGTPSDQRYSHSENFLRFTLNSVSIKVDNSYSFLVSGLKFEVYPTNGDYSGFYTSPSSIDLESSNIDF
jgi:hypothetical protein